MGNKRIPLEPDRIYHVYNHAINNENLFRNADNYVYFLKLYKKHISAVAHTFAYCLMPNHFHFLVRIKSESELLQLFKPDMVSAGISQIFGNLFNAYTKAINKTFVRKGTLYNEEFNRKLIDKHDYLQKSVLYIHNNRCITGLFQKLPNGNFLLIQVFYPTNPPN